jgi:hypothetical protein
MKRRTLGGFLWLSIFAWAIGLGAKVFDLLVLGIAWGRSPPQSFALLPYGVNYPVDPGNFFQPLSALLVIGLVGALVAGWRLRPVRQWLFVVAAALVVIWACTPTLFWPLIVDLWETSRGRQPHTVLEAQQMVRRWFLLDSARIVVIGAGFFGVVQALIAATVDLAQAHAGDPTIDRDRS